MQIVLGIILSIQFVIAVALIWIVAIQESRNEGLTGQIGTTVASSFKGKAGKEELLNLWTGRLGYSFLIISFLVAFLASRIK